MKNKEGQNFIEGALREWVEFSIVFLTLFISYEVTGTLFVCLYV